MAKDEEQIIGNLKSFIETRPKMITFYEMDDNHISTFNEAVLGVERNENDNAFPDFVGDSMYIEVFNVTSSRERNKGSIYETELSQLKERKNKALFNSSSVSEKNKGKSFVETLDYTNHSYQYWINSLKRNIEKHTDKHLYYVANGKNGRCGVFLAHYTQKVLSYIDEEGKEQWHRLGIDREALQLIADLLFDTELVQYFVLFNEMNAEVEVIPIKSIPSYLSRLNSNYVFFPRKGAGMVYIAVSEEI